MVAQNENGNGNTAEDKKVRMNAVVLVYSLVKKLGKQATLENIEAQAQAVRPKSPGTYSSCARRHFVMKDNIVLPQPSANGLRYAIKASAKRKSLYPLAVLFPEEYEKAKNSPTQ